VTRAYRVGVCTLFPEYFDGPLSTSILGRAIRDALVAVTRYDVRDFSDGRHRNVDDTPYGGGAGMVMRAPELGRAVTYARAAAPGAPVLYLSPQGAPFEQAHARALAEAPGMILVCGRYEGVDERFIARHVDYELCVGDAVLTGGEPAAALVIDAVCRLLPGVLGNAASAEDESFATRRLEYPQFTRPAQYDGLDVPEVLRGGDHGAASAWRERLSLARTASRRPEWGDAASCAALASVEESETWLVASRHPDMSVDGGKRSCMLRRPSAGPVSGAVGTMQETS
jgi:tRNA (guanine37-N1)-methyltransferase